MTWAALLCCEGSATLKMDYTFMRLGEHLGTALHSSAKGVPVLLGHLDALLLCAQGYHGLVTHATTMTAMHKLMIVYPLLKILFEAAGMPHVEAMSDYGYVPGWVDLMHISVVSVNQGARHSASKAPIPRLARDPSLAAPGERQTSVTMTILLKGHERRASKAILRVQHTTFFARLAVANIQRCLPSSCRASHETFVSSRCS